MHNRREKLQFLKDLLRGKRSVSELQPTKFSVWIVDQEAGKYMHEGVEYTREQYLEMTKDCKTAHNVSFNLKA